MSDNIQNALLITAIGMGLVFFAILLLWGLMELLVRLTTVKERPPAGPASPNPPGNSPKPADESRRRAAAAAVAVALALQRSAQSISPAAPATPLSAWQAAMRAGRLSQRANIFRRRSRGNLR